MKITFKTVYDWLHSKDWITWIGHGVAGFLITWAFGPTETFVAFAYREGSDVGKEIRAGEKIKWKDHFFDLWAPLAGAAVALILGL